MLQRERGGGRGALAVLWGEGAEPGLGSRQRGELY